MATTSPPVHPSTPPGFDVKAVFSGVAHGAWSTIAQSPWLGALVAVLIVSGVVRFVRGIVHSGHPKDAVRRFSHVDRRVIFARAGGRREHHFPIFGRCRTTTGLEADHVHPHSRGVWTSVSNGQALCRRHNREKSARVPWNWRLNKLAKRRATYFDPLHDPVVVPHRPRTPCTPKSAAPATQQHHF